MFATEAHADQALGMNGWMLRGRHVMVERCSMEAFERAIDSYIPPGGAGGGGKMLGSSPAMSGDRPPMKRPRSRSPPKREGSLAVVVKNLPFTVQKREIFRHFNGVRFAKGDTSVTIEYHKDGRPNGTALIELATERDLQTALKMHRREELGGRLVDVISIPYKEYAERVETAIKYTPKDGSSPRKASPPSSSSKDKLTRVKDEKPSMTSRGGGKDSGDVKDSKSNGSSSSKDDKSGRSKVSGSKVSGGSKVSSTGGGGGSSSAADKKEDKIFCVKMHGVPYDVTKEQIQDFFKGLQISNKGVRIVYLPNGKSSHICFVEFVTSEDCKKALAKDKEYIGSRYINISGVTKKQMMDDFYRMTDRSPPGSAVAQQVGKPGCVVSIQNLHFDATLEDILHFFRGFGPLAESVKMRYNIEDGRPMGDAMLAFRSRHEAQRAVNDMHRRQLMGRPVSLAIM